MKRLFLDTEFTHLNSNAKLISIALVSEDGDEFYAELVGTYKLHDTSWFVTTTVLPLLQGGKYEMTWNETKVNLRAWLERQGPAIIATDSLRWDWPWIVALLDQGFPPNINTSALVLSMNYLKNFDLFCEILNKEQVSLRLHHARDDAIANLRAWKGSGGDTLDEL